MIAAEKEGASHYLPHHEGAKERRRGKEKGGKNIGRVGGREGERRR